MARAYYRNSLKAWRDRLLSEERLGAVRLKRMRDIKHPDANDQAILMDVNRQMIEVVEAAQRVADAIDRRAPTQHGGQGD